MHSLRGFRFISVGVLVIFTFTFSGLVNAVSERDQDLMFDETEDPQIMYAILTQLGRSMTRDNNVQNYNKRGLDLGLSRGYSGSLQAKHMMGIAAAGLSGGPGRRRRSHSDIYHRNLSY